MLTFVPVLILILAVFVILVVVLKKQGNEERGDFEMKPIYIYVVLFATLMMTIGGGIGIFMSLSDLVSPPSGYYQPFDQYKAEQKKMAEADAAKAAPKSESELRAAYDEMVKTEKERTKQNALNTLIKSLGFIVIPFPVFLYYQRRLRA